MAGGVADPASSSVVGNSKALDQFRGLALIMVLVSHGFFYTGLVDGIGRVGVNLFFFISGILVFRSLTSSSAIRKHRLAAALTFYRKRFVRLFPALATYLAIMTPVVYLFQQTLSLAPHSSFAEYVRSLPIALLFAVDYDHAAPATLGHLWSVSVEMQYYLLAPAILFIGGKSFRQRLFVWGTLLCIFMFLSVSEPTRNFNEKYQFQVAVWPMLLGFLGEYVRGYLPEIPATRARTVIRMVWLSLLSIFFVMIFTHNKTTMIEAGASIIIPCYLSYAARISLPGFVGRGLTWLGERTYSIYLWQQPFTLCHYFPDIFDPLGALISIAIGAVSYEFTEEPFLSRKSGHLEPQSMVRSPI
jgi:peptidoglycan/LPS O-acetylase OafA/YrhL